MDLFYRAGPADEAARAVKVERPGGRCGGCSPATEDCLRVEIGGRHHAVEVLRAEGGALSLRVDGRTVRAWVAPDGDRRAVQIGGAAPVALSRTDGRKARARGRAGSAEDTLTASMHGLVVAVLVKPGDAVERGMTLVILEAMKMEMRVAAPHAGRVRAVACKVGEVVERGRVMLELDAST